MWKDAAIAADADYQKFIKRAENDTAAPLDMRRMLVDWPQSRNLRGFTGWPQQMSVSFEHKRIAISWSGEFACSEEEAEASRLFAATLAKQGYRPLATEELEVFQRRLEYPPNKGQAVYKRMSGETELLVSFEVSPYVGSSANLSGVHFAWFVRRPYRAQSPKLADVLAALPAWMKMKYLDEKFYASLADEPIASISSGRDIRVGFTRPIKEKLIRALEQNGFDYEQEHSPGRDGSEQKTWSRFSDSTYAHVITPVDGKSVRLSCQAPQHKGKPRTGKPLPMHPSLRLPQEKRPILSFDQLSFADAALARQTKLFQELAEQVAQPDWQVQLYKDGRYSREPLFTAYWQSSVVKSTNYIPKVRPYHGVSITLQGRHGDGVDELNSLHAGGTLVPRSGWAAQVSYQLSPSRDGMLQPTMRASAGLAQEHNVFSFDHNGSPNSILLTQQIINATVHETQHHHYRFQAQSVGLDLERSLRMLYGTPETLRDDLLAEIAAFRKQAREELETGNTLTYFNMTNVRSDNPPREEPAQVRPPSVASKKALGSEIEKKLAAQEAVVRENFRVIHAAVQQALPLGKLLDEFSPDKR